MWPPPLCPFEGEWQRDQPSCHACETVTPQLQIDSHSTGEFVCHCHGQHAAVRLSFSFAQIHSQEIQHLHAVAIILLDELISSSHDLPTPLELEQCRIRRKVG